MDDIYITGIITWCSLISSIVTWKWVTMLWNSESDTLIAYSSSGGVKESHSESKTQLTIYQNILCNIW